MPRFWGERRREHDDCGYLIRVAPNHAEALPDIAMVVHADDAYQALEKVAEMHRNRRARKQEEIQP